jgi:transposase/ribosomal protein S15P/S13E
MKRKRSKATFKPYTQNQLMLPTDLNDLIPEKHLVRVVNEVIDEMDLESLLKQYKGGGTSSYHPKMMLKILVYAYTQKEYSSRRIAKAIRENINYMWLSGGNSPNFRTINRFRGVMMRTVIEEVFTEVLEYLIARGYVKVENYFIDGTKIEANANRYSFVWRKSTENYKKKLEEKVREMMDEVERENEEEGERYGDKDLEELGEEAEVDSEDLKELAKRLNEKLKEKPKDKQLKKAVKKLERDFIPRMEKYERYEDTFEGRNSFSKTDEDATFMCMKEDHMRNRKLKPGYNVQIGTEHQFVTGYSIHQRPGDSPCLIPHMEKVREQLGSLPKKVIADAGYGSEENYAYLEDQAIDAYVKYGTYHREQKKRRKIPEREMYWSSNWMYDEQQDEFTCPQGKRLTYEFTRTVRTDNGYRAERRVYRCAECEACPVQVKCTRSKYGRRVRFSLLLRKFRQTASERLQSPEGKDLRSQRLVEAEAVFGQLKHNWGFRRFLLRGLEKVNTEWGLLCVAHNIAKLAAS